MNGVKRNVLVASIALTLAGTVGGLLAAGGQGTTQAAPGSGVKAQRVDLDPSASPSAAPSADPSAGPSLGPIASSTDPIAGPTKNLDDPNGPRRHIDLKVKNFGAFVAGFCVKDIPSSNPTDSGEKCSGDVLAGAKNATEIDTDLTFGPTTATVDGFVRDGKVGDDLKKMTIEIPVGLVGEDTTRCARFDGTSVPIAGQKIASFTQVDCNGF